MKKLCAVAFCLVTASSQLLSAAAWAQSPPPPAPAPAPPAPSPNTVNRGPADGPSLAVDVCKPVPLAATWLPLSLDPPREWRGKSMSLHATLNQDGSVADVNVVGDNGAPAPMQAAARAMVKQAYRWAPLACDRTTSGAYFGVGLPRLNCSARSWRAPLPLTMAQESRNVSASLKMTITAAGRMEPQLTSGSGDAALDAALLAHIRQNWHFWSLDEGCASDTRFQVVRFPEAACIPRPVAESRTMPEGGARDRQRAVALLIGVAPDGKLMFTSVVQSSGDAAADAAAAAHVKANWRWQPITCARKQIYARGEALPVMDFANITFR